MDAILSPMQFTVTQSKPFAFAKNSEGGSGYHRRQEGENVATRNAIPEESNISFHLHLSSRGDQGINSLVIQLAPSSPPFRTVS